MGEHVWYDMACVQLFSSQKSLHPTREARLTCLLLLLATCALFCLGSVTHPTTHIVIQNRLHIMEAHDSARTPSGDVSGNDDFLADGPGEMGRPVVLTGISGPEIKARIEAGWKAHAFNQYARKGGVRKQFMTKLTLGYSAFVFPINTGSGVAPRRDLFLPKQATSLSNS